MPRYFLELSYKGTVYSGFQVQENARTIQWEVEKALETLYRQRIALTGSSRTDAGVHARQNFFHFDTEGPVAQQQVYNLNALLPADIAVKAFYQVEADAHARFSAISREYNYHIYNKKDPFLYDRAWYYPFKIDEAKLHEAAQLVLHHTHFPAFSKRNTQVNNYVCSIQLSDWRNENGCYIYTVRANRFLRGMVRALVATMLKVARGSLTIEGFQRILDSAEPSLADFSAPAHGLVLYSVKYPDGLLQSLG